MYATLLETRDMSRKQFNCRVGVVAAAEAAAAVVIVAAGVAVAAGAVALVVAVVEVLVLHALYNLESPSA